MQVSTTRTLTCPETVHQRPCMSDHSSQCSRFCRTSRRRQELWWREATIAVRSYTATNIAGNSADTRRHLRSANRHLLAVPHFRLDTNDRRAFPVAGPMAWNSLPNFIGDPTSSTDCLSVYLKRTCSRVTSGSSALGVLNDYALYTNPRTHSLTAIANVTESVSVYNESHARRHRRSSVRLIRCADSESVLYMYPT